MKTVNKDLKAQTVIIAAVFLGIVRSLFLAGFFHDDNYWMQSAYISDGFFDFLDDGFIQLKRPLIGAVSYVMFAGMEHYPNLVHLINLGNALILAATSVAIYRFLARLFPGNNNLAFFSGLLYVLSNIDLSIFIHVNIVYRLAVLFSVISFSAMVYFAEERRSKWLASSVLFFSLSILLMESSLMYEPARLFLCVLLFSRQGLRGRKLLFASLKLWTPFVAIGAVYGAYKVIYMPVGTYSQAYVMNPANFLNGSLYLSFLSDMFFATWYYLGTLYRYVSPWSAVMVVAAVAALLMIKKADLGGGGASGCESSDVEVRRRELSPFFFGILLIAFPALLYILLKQVPYPFDGPGTRHSSAVKLGHSIVAGGILDILLAYFGSRLFWGKIIRAVVLTFFCLGIFFANANIDVYRASMAGQKKFWRAFMERFPSLPENADFLIDVPRGTVPHTNLNLRQHGEFELVLNLLYAAEGESGLFRRYRVLTPADVKPEFGQGGESLTRYSHWGEDRIIRNDLIAVLYEDGKVYVNDEIVAGHPDIPYGFLAEGKSPPSFSGRPGSYPLRNRLPWIIAE